MVSCAFDTDTSLGNPSPTLGGRGFSHPALLRAAELKSEWSDLCSEFLPLTPERSPWRYSRPLARGAPPHGWKIHLSATILTGCATLRLVGPFLKQQEIAFKGPTTLDQLRKINSGIWYGYQQVGKFITVYPNSDDEFRSLCARLHELTSHLSPGPAIPFDEVFRSSSSVYYRFGPFGEQLSISDQHDEVGGVLATRADPFHSCSDQNNPTPKAFSDRYHVYRALSQRGKGGVYEALDIEQDPPRPCVIKEGRKNGETGWDDRDGYSRNKNEVRILTALSHAFKELPKLIDAFETDRHAYLVMERIEGVTVQKILNHFDGRLDFDFAVHLCLKITRFVSDLHINGFVWRDLKPSNIILEKSGELRIVDLEGACRVNEFDPLCWSTPSFAPPEVCTGAYLSERSSNLPEDLYALGRCLYLLLEAKTPMFSYEAERDLEMHRRIRHASVRNIVNGLLSSDPDKRPSAPEALRILTNSYQRHLL